MKFQGAASLSSAVSFSSADHELFDSMRRIAKHQARPWIVTISVKHEQFYFSLAFPFHSISAIKNIRPALRPFRAPKDLRNSLRQLLF
jgi:hypothetical protein